MIKKNSKGFTILELVIASSVFGVIMLIAMTGILYIGRSYYKGITTARTQEATRSITQEITNTFQYGGTTPITHAQTAPPSNAGAYCIGKFRYSYVTGSRVSGDDSSATGPISKHALWLDILEEGGQCLPLDLNQDTPADENTDQNPDSLAQRRELIPNNMRLDRFNLEQSVEGSYLTTDVNVIYGEQDLSPGGVCAPNREGGQFCARSALTTTVKKRL